MRPAIVPVIFGERRTSVSAVDSAFDPSTVSGLQFDYRSDVGLFTTSGGTTAASFDDDPVGRWEDQSVNGRHLTQATGSKRPLLKLGVLPSGKPVVRGDGVDDVLKSAAFGAALSQPIHIFIALRQVTWTDSDTVFDGLATDDLMLYQVNASPNMRMYSAPSGNIDTSELALTTAGVLSLVYNGASSKRRLNGGTAATGTVGSDTLGALSLFARGGDSNFGNIDIGRILAFDGEKTGSDFTYLNSGLMEWAGVS